MSAPTRPTAQPWPILQWPDPRLRTPCAPVEADDDISELVSAMFEAMYGAQGRGLAAPQVGVLKRVFVMDAGWKTARPTPRVLINPRLVRSGGARVEGIEVCLSIPGVEAPVMRHETVVFASEDRDRHPCEVALEGAEARIAQHEFDHLDGLVTFDRLDGETRARLEPAAMRPAPESKA